ncbi:flagellar basal body L-ring protein FlgH [Acidiphilium acidophilum]|jgi:flagellar L-ring protein precursor FlgH|uniref:Flagellar L-ring protein n=2 Tax=Acidiphilium acidophilum TaxID=76588 RepID=A0AAW9DMZ5_ACIAO|nr:flagellar basal body L-ring protein FlgH [Acidiphilium acidophilum]
MTRRSMSRPARLATLLAVSSLSGCGTFSNLAYVGKAPPMSPITNPTAAPTWRPVSMPMPPLHEVPTAPDSLWRRGARAFFKDQRASRVGDIITITVNINDDATLKDQTTLGRTSSESLGVPNLFGLESLIPRVLGKSANPSSLVSLSGAGNSTGTGQIQRNESVALSLAGEITQVLPDGNFVVVARQEMRVNDELRVLTVSGICRPQDIASSNTIQANQLAEARISYGGRGLISGQQSPRVGQQVLDDLVPF